VVFVGSEGFFSRGGGIFSEGQRAVFDEGRGGDGGAEGAGAEGGGFGTNGRKNGDFCSTFLHFLFFVGFQMVADVINRLLKSFLKVFCEKCGNCGEFSYFCS